MKKSELLYYDMEAPDWLVSRTNLRKLSLVREKDEEAGLMIYKFYCKEHIEAGEHQPYFVIFKDKHTWINYYPQEKRWTKGSLDHTYDVQSYYFLKVLRNLRRWQDKILKKRYKAKKKVEMHKTSVVMSYVPELPEDFQEFCKEEVMEDANYLVYSSKRRRVYCTNCRQEYDIKDLIQRNERKVKHGQKAMCDKCLIEMESLSEGMSRRGKYFRRYAEIMQLHEYGIVVRRFNIFRDFNESLTPETSIYEVWRHIFDEKTVSRYELRWDAKGNQRWNRIRSGGYFTTVTYYTGKPYVKNVEAVIENSIYRNRGLLDYFKNRGVKEELVKVLENVSAHPSLEQIMKVGLYEFATEMISGHVYRSLIDETQTELTKMLKINKEQLRWIRCREKTYDALNLLQTANEKGKYVSETELDAYLKSGCGWNEKDFILNSKINTKKACAYILEQEITISDFKDHMELLTKLGLPWKKTWLYPKDFEKVHQEEIEMDISQNDKVSAKLQKQYKKTYDRWKRIAEKVNMQDEKYRIIFPTDCKDIKIEGKVLHHCVGNYVERAAKGETVILFMRSLGDMERRLYTMEYQDGKLIQIRASCNGKPEEDARILAERFAADFAKAEARYKKQEEKKSKKAAV